MLETTAWITAWIAANSGTVIILFLGYLLFLALLGSMPPVPNNAPYAARWAYGFLHLLALNLNQAAALLPIKLPKFLKKDVSKADNCTHTQENKEEN